jgi:excisionase family DNA binding protein
MEGMKNQHSTVFVTGVLLCSMRTVPFQMCFCYKRTYGHHFGFPNQTKCNKCSQFNLIQIPAWTPPENPKQERTKEAMPRITVSVQEGADVLGISKPHFLPLIKEGKIRTIKIGRRILVSVQSLREFVDGKKAPRNSRKITTNCRVKKNRQRHRKTTQPPLAI